MMVRFLMMVAVAMMTAVSAQAQKIQTVDKDGQPIPYASIISEDGNVIGTTDLNGILDDVKGAEVVSITHVAYQPKKVKVGQGGRVMLEDADFGLPEITVTKKPLVYAQTYYRWIYLNDDPETKVCYYRAGVFNNSYDRKTKKVSKDESHISACNIGVLKTAINLIFNGHKAGGLNPKKVEDRLKDKFKETGLTFSPNGPGKQRITDKYGVVGSVTDNHDKGERRYSLEAHKMMLHLTQATGSDKKKAKSEKKEARKKNYVDQDFLVYRIDDDGNYAPEDFVMGQYSTSYDDEKYNGRVVILFQMFTTDRAYVTKDELKKIKKENKMKMTYQNILDFERAHNIPPVPSDLGKRIREVVNK